MNYHEIMYSPIVTQSALFAASSLLTWGVTALTGSNIFFYLN